MNRSGKESKYVLIVIGQRTCNQYPIAKPSLRLSEAAGQRGHHAKSIHLTFPNQIL